MRKNLRPLTYSAGERQCYIVGGETLCECFKGLHLPGRNEFRICFRTERVFFSIEGTNVWRRHGSQFLLERWEKENNTDIDNKIFAFIVDTVWGEYVWKECANERSRVVSVKILKLNGI